MNWNSRDILVTGAGGFIGSHLVHKLVKLGGTVKALVRYNSRNDIGLLKYLPTEILGNVEVILGDLKDYEIVRNSMKGTNIIFHLGALIGIPYSYICPGETISNNIIATLNVMKASREEVVERIIHTSSSEVYGTAQYVPIDEMHPLQGQSPYSASKIGADKIAESYFLSFDSPVSIIRPFNTYGPRQSARAVIPTIISQVLAGSQINLGSLETIRDFTYIEDTIEGFIKMAECKEAVGEVINIGSNNALSIGEIANIVIDLTNVNAEIVVDTERIRPEKSEVRRLQCDNTKAMDILGWKPKHSIQEGIGLTIEWISENREYYRPHIYNI